MPSDQTDQRTQVEDWFTYHEPTDLQRQKLEGARSAFREIALWLVDNVANSRERAIALTELRAVARSVNTAIIFDRP